MPDSHECANDADHAYQDRLEDFKQHHVIGCLFAHGLGDKNQAIKNPGASAYQTQGKGHLCPELAYCVPVFRGSSVCRHCKFLWSQGLWYKYRKLHIEAAHTHFSPSFSGLGKDNDSGLRTLSNKGLSAKVSGFLSRFSLSISLLNRSTFST